MLLVPCLEGVQPGVADLSAGGRWYAAAETCMIEVRPVTAELKEDSNRKCIKAAQSSEKHIGDLPGGVGLFDEWNQIGGTEMGDRPFTYFKI